MAAPEARQHVCTLNTQVRSLIEVLPDGFTVETCPAAVAWWRRAAECLVQGKLVAIDYGLTDEEVFVPERREGTLRGYRGHRLSHDILADPGEQDITAHVNFGAIQRAGEAAGLSTDALLSQAQFLTPLVERLLSFSRRHRDHEPKREPSPRPSPLRRAEGDLSGADEVSEVLGATRFMESQIGEWTSARIRQFQTLTHPEHLGRAFRVLVQSRDGALNS